MKKLISLVLLTSLGAWSAGVSAVDKARGNPMVRMTTSVGVIEIELDSERAPVTTQNFLSYVDKKSYDGTIFHRVIPNFMIQGGGFEREMKQKKTDAPIINEADNGLKNDIGTIAMARTSSPHSASAQFFINVADNKFLNHRDKTTQGWGYAVFGKVTKGMEVVKKIASTPTRSAGTFENVPVTDVVIEKIERVDKR